MLGPALPQGALPQVVDAVLSRRHLRGLQVRHVSVSGYAFRAAAWHCMLGKCVCNVARTVSGMAAHQLCTVKRALLGAFDARPHCAIARYAKVEIYHASGAIC